MSKAIYARDTWDSTEPFFNDRQVGGTWGLGRHWMPANLNRPELWKADIERSVDFYNAWFMRFAPKAFRESRDEATEQVKEALRLTSGLFDLSSSALESNPWILPILRMVTAPPIARDRLIGLAGVPPTLVRSMELQGRIPPRMARPEVEKGLENVASLILRMADVDLFPWLEARRQPSDEAVNRASTIVADRLTGARSDPIIRNAQERRQLSSIRQWLEKRGYVHIETGHGLTPKTMDPGTFIFRLNVPVALVGRTKKLNIPVDVAIMLGKASQGDLPIMIEAKSAGDFTNPNKRRKEEAQKMSQLRNTYGDDIRYILFLCGYFDTGYLGYEAAEGIDWVWEHRIDDLVSVGI